LTGLERKPDFDIVRDIQKFRVWKIIKRNAIFVTPRFPHGTSKSGRYRIHLREWSSNTRKNKTLLEKKKPDDQMIRWSDDQMIRCVQIRNQIDLIEIIRHPGILPLNFGRFWLNGDEERKRNWTSNRRSLSRSEIWQLFIFDRWVPSVMNWTAGLHESLVSFQAFGRLRSLHFPSENTTLMFLSVTPCGERKFEDIKGFLLYWFAWPRLPWGMSIPLKSPRLSAKKFSFSAYYIQIMVDE
jgi:hypothetical protein